MKIPDSGFSSILEKLKKKEKKNPPLFRIDGEKSKEMFREYARYLAAIIDGRKFH